MSKIAFVVCAVVSLISFKSWSQTYDYAAYGLFPQGSSRAMGMGWAYTAVSDDAGGIIFNPAGLGVGRWKADFGGTNNHIDNREYDVTGNGGGFGLPYTFIFYGGAVRFGTWVLGAGYNSPYNMDYKDESIGKEQKLSITSLDVVLAKSFAKVFSVGVTGHAETVNLKYYYVSGTINDDKETTVKGNYFTVGALFKQPKISLGISYSSSQYFDVDENLNTGLTFGRVWFRDVSIPSKVSIGVKYEAKSDFIIAVDLDKYSVLKKEAIFPGTGDDGDTFATTILDKDYQVIHGGLEWYLSKSSESEVIWRLGAYNEPTRFLNGSDRSHFTMGLEVRFGPAILSVAYDTAKDFKNSSAGFSLSFGNI